MNKKPEKTNKAASPKEALTAIKKVTKRFLDREDNYLDQQRQVLFVFYALFLSCGLLTNITGLSGTFHPFYTTMNSIMLAEIVVLSVAYITRRLSIVKTIGCMTLSLQLCLAVETVRQHHLLFGNIPHSHQQAHHSHSPLHIYRVPNSHRQQNFARLFPHSPPHHAVH